MFTLYKTTTASVYWNIRILIHFTFFTQKRQMEVEKKLFKTLHIKMYLLRINMNFFYTSIVYYYILP